MSSKLFYKVNFGARKLAVRVDELGHKTQIVEVYEKKDIHFCKAYI